jgi:hypothetical protein
MLTALRFGILYPASCCLNAFRRTFHGRNTRKLANEIVSAFLIEQQLDVVRKPGRSTSFFGGGQIADLRRRAQIQTSIFFDLDPSDWRRDPASCKAKGDNWDSEGPMFHPVSLCNFRMAAI